MESVVALKVDEQIVQETCGQDRAANASAVVEVADGGTEAIVPDQQNLVLLELLEDAQEQLVHRHSAIRVSDEDDRLLQAAVIVLQDGYGCYGTVALRLRVQLLKSEHALRAARQLEPLTPYRKRSV